jgi:hypothetical protein
MGESMTVQMPIVSEPAVLDHAFFPPVAPLLMPIQVLEPDSSLLARMAAPLLACIALLRHGFRRAD